MKNKKMYYAINEYNRLVAFLTKSDRDDTPNIKQIKRQDIKYYLSNYFGSYSDLIAEARISAIKEWVAKL